MILGSSSVASDVVESLSFETALVELEEVVGKLEEGQVPLEEAVALYERGAHLKAHCAMKLKNAQLKIEKIIAQDGIVTATEPFEPRHTDAEG
ncbi:MAG: exodeoxyribonuclease VII small subunit [Holosporales bacterium]|jgi:exodeoxyribonuclease VII small subunit|nr:exodeoxyribonuclease VII small subunit [Holosporales bacterium]